MKPQPGRSEALAIAVLQHLGGRPCDDALVGDLLEQAAAGRTAVWLWREVLVALAIGARAGIRTYWQELGSLVIGTGIVLACGDAPWRRQWVDFLWSSAAEHHFRWVRFAVHAFALEATYGATLVLLGLLVIFVCRGTPAWKSVVQFIPASAVFFTQTQFAFLLLGDPTLSFWDLRHLVILACNAGTLFLALLIPTWMNRPPGPSLPVLPKAFILLCAIALIAPAAVIPDTPTGNVLRAWLDAFDSGDTAKLEGYSKTFDPRNLMTQYVDISFSRRSGGFELLSVTAPEPGLLRFHLKEKNSPTEGMGSLRVEGNQRPTVAAFHMNPLPPGVVIHEIILDAAGRQRVIAGAIANLKEYYVYPPVAEKMAQALLAHEKNGDNHAETDGGIFAAMLTQQLRAVSHDGHLSVDYNPFKQAADQSGAPNPAEVARVREAMKRSNCGFETASILPHNIGYLKFNAFFDPDVCKPTVEASMKTLAGVSAIIFDLRDNRGGDPNMVSLICSYLFERRTHLNDIYFRTENRTEQYWTAPPTAGIKLAHIPAYVLTSRRTFSGAEEFCYDLKNLKRATLVGETTGGGAHLVRPRPIDDQFVIMVPFGRPINPVSKKDWEGTGVEPDVKVKADDALATAQKLAAK